LRFEEKEEEESGDGVEEVEGGEVEEGEERTRKEVEGS
jgi:hypothetical protein